jgi:hypothetical protein
MSCQRSKEPFYFTLRLLSFRVIQDNDNGPNVNFMLSMETTFPSFKRWQVQLYLANRLWSTLHTGRTKFGTFVEKRSFHCPCVFFDDVPVWGKQNNAIIKHRVAFIMLKSIPMCIPEFKEKIMECRTF